MLRRRADVAMYVAKDAVLRCLRVVAEGIEDRETCY
jgi:hypothetical protein